MTTKDFETLKVKYISYLKSIAEIETVSELEILLEDFEAEEFFICKDPRELQKIEGMEAIFAINFEKFKSELIVEIGQGIKLKAHFLLEKGVSND